MSFEFTMHPSAPPSFAHLRRLTDDTGLLEHALGRIPRRTEGYTTDDNARALWLMTEWLSLGNAVLNAELQNQLTKLAEIYMAFMVWTQYRNGWWHNNVAYNRVPEEEDADGNHDCQGRAIWAAADAWVRLDGALADTAFVMIQRALPTFGQIHSRRGQAFVMAACAHMLEAGQHNLIQLPASWRLELTLCMERYERLLIDNYRCYSNDHWRWFESTMTYSNGLLPWAMLRTYRVTLREETLQTGLDSLSFLLDAMTAEEGWLRPIGNDGWGSPDGFSRWDQQPLEIFKLVLALEEAALAITVDNNLRNAENLVTSAATKSMIAATNMRPGDDGAPGRFSQQGMSFAAARRRSPDDWRKIKHWARSWFYGNNDLDATMCDPSDGSCCDGLMENGPNINCGAESTLSYLMTEALCRRPANHVQPLPDACKQRN
jgi:hypothetical protein